MVQTKNKAMLPTNDYVFKRIFGYKGKEMITKRFIEAITQYKIEKISLEKSTILEKDLSDDKIGILDVRAVLNGNIQCDIEMQMVNKDNIEERLLFYWSKLFGKTIKQGEEYSGLNKTIVIMITDFELEKLKTIPKFHTEFKIREKDFSQIILTDVLEIHIIELSKILEKIKQNTLDKKDELSIWTMFLINPESIGGKEMSKNKELQEAKKVYNEIQQSEREQELAEMRMKYIMDQKATERYGFKQGVQEGIRQGVQQGREEGTIEERKRIAKQMREKGIDVKAISKITKLKIEEIEKI